MGGEVMRKRRDNAVINSVWTSSVCMQGSPLVPPGHRSVGNLLFLGVCTCCVVRSDGRNTCKRGSLVPADKCMLHVTVVQLTLGFKSDRVWCGHPSHNEIQPCVVRVSCDCQCGDAAFAMINTFTLSHVFLAAKSIYIFALFNGMSELILSMKPCI